MTPQNEVLHIGNLQIEISNYRLLQDGDIIRLTPTEWALLRELLLHANQVLSHRFLLQRVWGVEYGEESDYVHTYISRLRRKLEIDKNNPRYIMTEPGIGYWFDTESHIEQLQPTSTPKYAPSIPDNDPIDSMMDDIARMQSASHPQNRLPRYINPLPQDVRYRYVGREHEQQEIKRMLHENAPLVSIYGRGGMGKTALVCKVLSDLQDDPAYSGIVYLSASSTGINLGRIFTDFAKLFGAPWEQIEPTWSEQPLAQKITRLLEMLNDKNYILLLDNLEDLQNTVTFTLTDDDLNLFLRLVLQQAHKLRVVVTSRYPLDLPLNLKARERMISLEQGLPIEESIQLLRNCDPDNAAKVRDAHIDKLALIAKRTGGLPRALEVVVGILLVVPLLSLEDLIGELAQHVNDIGADMVGQIIKRLEPEAQRLMGIASAFKHPFSQEAIEKVSTPFISTNVRTILNDLLRAYFLSYNPGAQLFSIHPIDEAHCYPAIPETASDGYFKANIHHTIAEYYGGKTSSRVPSLLDDLDMNLKEIQQRVLAGEYDTAADLLVPLDEQYLFLWGHYAELHDLYSELQGKIKNNELVRKVSLRHAEVFRAMGRLHDARIHYEQAFHAAQSPHDEAKALSGLGWTYYELGSFETAVVYLEKALYIFKDADDQPGMGSAHGGMGWVSYLRGDYPTAQKHFEDALAIFRTLGDEYGVAVNLGDLGVVRLANLEYSESVSILQEALQIAEHLNATREKSYKGRYLATALLIGGSLDEAQEVALKTSRYEIPVNQPVVEALLGVIMALQGEADEATRAFKSAIHHADRVLRYQFGLYDLRYARGLANAGLCVVAGADVQMAIDDYLSAKSVCSEVGVLNANLHLLEVLAKAADEEILLPVVQMLT